MVPPSIENVKKEKYCGHATAINQNQALYLSHAVLHLLLRYFCVFYTKRKIILPFEDCVRDLRLSGEF